MIALFIIIPCVSILAVIAVAPVFFSRRDFFESNGEEEEK